MHLGLTTRDLFGYFKKKKKNYLANERKQEQNMSFINCETKIKI